MDSIKNYLVPQRVYSTTNKNDLPKHLPLVGLGCSSFSSFFSSGGDDEASLTVDTISKDHPVVIGWVETIRHAVLNRGINLLDTAPWYGHGVSETVIGYALDTILSDEGRCDQAQRKRTGSLARSDIIINTKVGRYESDPLKQFDFSYEKTIQSVERSLKRMNCNYIDVLQLHDPEFSPSISQLMIETIPALLECKRRGWTRALGLTGYPLDIQHEILVKAATEFPDDAMVFDQSLVYCHSNLHDMSLFCDFLPTPEGQEAVDGSTSLITFSDFCQRSQIHLMAAAPLSMGLLTHAGPPAWHPASAALKTACVKASTLCENEGVNISSLAIMYSLSHPSIGCTLLGMKDRNEVDFAADLASRFITIDFESESQKSILDQVLTLKESNVLEKLLDESDGPFSQLEEEYRWDGRKEASKFWALVNDVRKRAA
jgi:aryl-alcohol dehydrogenase-like predicted oxidoreductase